MGLTVRADSVAYFIGTRRKQKFLGKKIRSMAAMGTCKCMLKFTSGGVYWVAESEQTSGNYKI